jgi:hypothetical protein
LETAVLRTAVFSLKEEKMKCIKVWKWDDAPAEYRQLSPHGGDEDWLAFIPESMKEEWIPWMEDGRGFGCDVSEHSVKGGIIRIGVH